MAAWQIVAWGVAAINVGLAILVLLAAFGPEGYETKRGFHYGKPPHDITDSDGVVQLTPHRRSLSGASYYLPSEGVGEGQFSDSDVRLANVLNFPVHARLYALEGNQDHA